MDLEQRAAELFEDDYLRWNWLAAVAYLRERGKWINDPGAPVPNWGLPPQRTDEDAR